MTVVPQRLHCVAKVKKWRCTTSENKICNVAVLAQQCFLSFWEVPVAAFEDKRTREGFTFLTFFSICRIYSSALCVVCVYCGVCVRFLDLVYSECEYVCVWLHGWHLVGVFSSEMLAFGLKSCWNRGSRLLVSHSSLGDVKVDVFSLFSFGCRPVSCDGSTQISILQFQ